MKTVLSTFAFLLVAHAAFAQNPDYKAHVHRADSLTKLKLYAPAADAYRKAFASLGGKAVPDDRYNAACVMSLGSQKDSAFYHLWRLAMARSVRYANYAHISTDPDLAPLHPDPRWPVLMDSVKVNKARKEVNLIKPVVAILDMVYIEDQKYRHDIGGLIEKYGMQSEQVQRQSELMNRADSINEIKVVKILDEYGWLGPDKVGEQGAMTIFLVIQHAALETQKKYLPMMRAAVAEKRAAGSSLAMLEDRVNLREGRKQVYGSQLITDQKTGKHRLQPLEDPDNVDKRRAEVGLPPLGDYLSHWGLAWDVEKFKQEEKEREKQNATKVEIPRSEGRKKEAGQKANKK